MQSIIQPIVRPILFCVAATLCATSLGCNFTTHSYNFGKMLLPGESMFTISGGERQVYAMEYQEPAYRTLSDTFIAPVYIPKYSTVFSGALAYHLGVLAKYPFGKGLEIGLLLEAPSQNWDFFGPPLPEFRLKTGFNDVIAGDALYHHNIMAGWDVGLWIDNGWFLEYAGSFEYDKIMPYFVVRGQMIATDPFKKSPIQNDVAENEINSFGTLRESEPSYIVRLTPGLAIKVPARFKILPEYICPEICVFFPNYSRYKKVGVTAHLGFQWIGGR
jgi:hypothetical protein